MWMAERLYKYPTQEVFRYHFKPVRPVGTVTMSEVTDKQKELRFNAGSMTDRPASKHWTQDKSGSMSERAELDYQMAPDLVRKDAPFGTLDTPTITMKIIGGKQVPVMYHHPVGIESYGSRIQPLQPITEKPNHLDPRSYGDNPAGYYNNVQDYFGEGTGSFDEEQGSPRPTAFVNKRPDSKDVTRQHYKALPPIQANRTRNDMSTVFEAETWTGNHNPPLAKETEYKTNYYSDIQSNEMEQNNHSGQMQQHLTVSKEEYDKLKRFLPANVLLPSEPITYPGLEHVLYRLMAQQLGNCDAKTLKYVYLDASHDDRDMRGFCSLEVLDKCLQKHHIRLDDLRLVAAQYVDYNYPGKINYERTLSFLSKALELRDRGRHKENGSVIIDSRTGSNSSPRNNPVLSSVQSSRQNSAKKTSEDMTEEDTPRSSDRPKYYKSNGETVKTGSIYKDREVAKLLRTVENELSKNSYFMDWTRWNSAFNSMDRDHRETLSASQIKDICYDNKLPLSDSILNQILALCEDNNRDGQYRWNEFLEFLSRVRPSNTGLPIPVSKRPLDFAKRIPEPVPNWPKTDGNTSPERHSPRKESPKRDPSPTRGGYTDRTATPTKHEVQIRENTPARQTVSPGRQSRAAERPGHQKPDAASDRQRYSPNKRHQLQDSSPERQFEQRYQPSPTQGDPSLLNRSLDARGRQYRSSGNHTYNNYQRGFHSPERYWSNDKQSPVQDGDDVFNRQENSDRTYKNETSGYKPSWFQDSHQKKSMSPVPPRLHNERDSNYGEEMRYLNRDSYDNYMKTWAQKQMRSWPNSRYNRPMSYAEPSRRQPVENPSRVRPLSYKGNISIGYDNVYAEQNVYARIPRGRNRSLSPVKQDSPERMPQHLEAYRESYRVPNPDIYREAYSRIDSIPYRDSQQHSQFPVYQPGPRWSSRFDGPPVPPGGYSGRDYGYNQRDGYGYDDYQKQGQFRYDDRMRGDREYQIKQLSSELKDLEAKYHMTQEAMKSHDKPWLDRYLKLAEALYKSDATNKELQKDYAFGGCLPRNVVIDIVEKYNDACNLGLDMNYARMVTFTPGNVDRSGNVLLKPYLTNLSGGRKQPGADGTQIRY